MATLAKLASLVLLSSAPLAPGAGPTTRKHPGDIAPAEVRAAADRATDNLRKAMKAEDEAAVIRASERLRTALGDWAGIPDRKPVSAEPPDPDPPITPERLKSLWTAAWSAAQKGYRGNGRGGLPPDHPDVEHALLRETAYVISGGLAGLRHRIGDEAQIRHRINEGLAYLLSVQRPDGLFPFPDLRSWDPHFKGPLESLYRQHPEAFQDGWVIEDYGDGGLQFDNAVCAVVLLDAWRQLGDTRYREAAQKACRWAAARPVVANWNYNAFSVWALAHYVEVTGDTEFLEPAIKKTRLGILPGQLPTGRWVDQHNARSVYHAIILRALATLDKVLPREASGRAKLEDALRRAEATLVDELYEHGASAADYSLSALWAAQRVLKPSPRRTAAMRIVINAMIARSGSNAPPLEDAGLFAAGQALDAFTPAPK